VLHGGPFPDQLVETEVMVMETSLLDVDHLEDSPWTAAKCTDNITLRHEAGVRWSFADLILALFPLTVALMLVLVMAQAASAVHRRASGAVSYELATQLFLF
jgi:hypothetical protein